MTHACNKQTKCRRNISHFYGLSFLGDMTERKSEFEFQKENDFLNISIV